MSDVQCVGTASQTMNTDHEHTVNTALKVVPSLVSAPGPRLTCNFVAPEGVPCSRLSSKLNSATSSKPTSRVKAKHS